MTARLVCFLVYFITTMPGYAQLQTPDTTFLAAAKIYQLQLYDKAIYGQSRLYNGSEYRDYLSRDDEHPYFGANDWAYGSIFYDDELYNNVPMFYDLSRDNVITEHVLNGAKLELVRVKVKRFSLAGHNFIRIGQNESIGIPEGFVEVLHDGTSKVYARREKILMQKVESNNIIDRFDERNRLYIQKDGTYFLVKKKSSVLHVFSDKKQELKTFIGKNKINYNTDRETAIVRMAEFYDAQQK